MVDGSVVDVELDASVCKCIRSWAEWSREELLSICVCCVSVSVSV